MRPCMISNVLSVFGRGASFLSSRAAEFALASVPAIVEQLGSAPDCVLVGRVFGGLGPLGVLLLSVGLVVGFAAVLRRAMRVAILLSVGDPWQFRLLLAEAAAGVVKQDLEVDPTPDQMNEKRAWMCLTPDGDIYAHLLDVPFLAGIAVFGSTGDVVEARGKIYRMSSKTYGSEWMPDPLEFSDAVTEAERAGGHSAARRLRGKQALPTGPAAGDSIPIPPEVTLEFDSLRDVKPWYWRVLAASESTPTHKVLSGSAVDWALVTELYALAMRGTELLVLKKVDSATDGSSELDARVLPVEEDAHGNRRRDFRSAVDAMTETAWPGWPVLGPRTVQWVLQFIREQGAIPRARHTKWKHEARLARGDPGVGDHELVMRVIETAVVYGQLNITELACFEIFCRRAQLSEWRQKDRLTGGASGLDDECADEKHLRMGSGETRGHVMVAPALQGVPRSVRSRLRRKAFCEDWEKEICQAVNSLYSVNAEPKELHHPSQAQTEAVRHFAEVVKSFGAPDETPATAFDALCGSDPGYGDVAAKHMPYQRDKVALPADGPFTEGEDNLSGEGVQLDDNCDLHMAQLDISNAFYRIRLPPGLHEHFVLPRLSRQAWLSIAPELAHPSQLIQDGCRVAKLTETTTAAGIYVDGVAVFSGGRGLALRGCEKVGVELMRRGLIAKGVVPPCEMQSFAGLTFDAASGKTSLSRKRLWRLRLALLRAAELGSISGTQLRRLVGRVAWAAILRRELLAVFSAVYRFMGKAGSRRWRMWGSVETEFRLAASLVCLAEVATRMPCADVVYAAGASGGSDGDYGSYGVVRRARQPADVVSTASASEKWRCRVGEEVAAREAALGLPPPPGRRPRQARRGGADFEAVGRELIGQPRDWQLVVRGRWAWQQDIGRTEGRTLVLGWSPLDEAIDAYIVERHGESATARAGESGPWLGGPQGEPAGLWQPVNAAAPLGAPGPAADEEGDSSSSASSGCRDFELDGTPAEKFTALSGQARARGRAFLELSRVSTAVQKQCQAALEKFDAWRRRSRTAARSLPELDAALAESLDEKFFDCFNRDAGDKLLAAMLLERPELRQRGQDLLPRARDAVAGFRKRAPGQARAPLPREGLLALVGAAAWSGRLEMALALTVAWHACLRLPSDLVAMVRESLVPPPPSIGGRRWGLLLCPGELGVVSKTGGVDEGMLLDDPVSENLGGALAALRERVPRGGQLWSFNAGHFRAEFARLAELAGMASMRAYQLRHGAASFDVATGVRDLAAVQRRLRHADSRRAKRCERHARYWVEVASLPQGIADYGRLLLPRWVELRLGAGEVWWRGDAAQAQSPLPAASVKRHLHTALQDCLKRSQRNQVFLDLFAGAGGLAASVQRFSSLACLRIDVKDNPALDLCPL
ncbi:unnamed protein product [Prorocentrum cordatum]|uniref:RNA-directed RNA polymerase n=1 Tax=Prorocentrum cordatum TaxID=2364126 RepID=A0ABN9QPM1_9DINO|nr:unnamed protein product [Polarella glacialis]